MRLGVYMQSESENEMWKCPYPDCEKEFFSYITLETHIENHDLVRKGVLQMDDF